MQFKEQMEQNILTYDCISVRIQVMNDRVLLLFIIFFIQPGHVLQMGSMEYYLTYFNHSKVLPLSCRCFDRIKLACTRPQSLYLEPQGSDLYEIDTVAPGQK